MSNRYLRPPDVVRIVTDDRTEQASAHDGTWTAAGVAVSTTVVDHEMKIRVIAPAARLRWVQLRWQGGFSAGARFLGDAWERSYGDLEWRGCVPERVMPWYFLACERDRTCGLGVKVQSGAMACWMVDPRGVTLWLDCRCGGEAVQLGGRELAAASVVAHDGAHGEPPLQVAQALCRRMCPAPRLPATPVFGGNNWYHAYGESSREQILAETERVASWAPASGERPFMIVDVGWEPAHTRGYMGGPWTEGNARFPDMPKCADVLRATGVRAGLWYRPLLTAESCPVEWRIAAPRKFGLVDSGHYLDPTVPAVRERLVEDMQRFTRQWGFELVKHDFSGYDMLGFWGSGLGGRYVADGWAFADRGRTTAEILVDFYRLLRQAAGDVPLLGCNTVGHLSAGLFEVHRSGDDTSGREWDRTRRMGVNTLAFRLCQHGTFFAVDADCVAVTAAVPWAFTRQWLELVAASNTPLFVSSTTEATGPKQSAAIKRAFARAVTVGPAGEPLDWMENTTPELWRLDGQERRFDWSGTEGAPRPEA